MDRAVPDLKEKVAGENCFKAVCKTGNPALAELKVWRRLIYIHM
jgi:hypothetical protein